jgi:hypothetical protein
LEVGKEVGDEDGQLIITESLRDDPEIIGEAKMFV